jgi:hypothetical protein
MAAPTRLAAPVMSAVLPDNRVSGCPASRRWCFSGFPPLSSGWADGELFSRSSVSSFVMARDYDLIWPALNPPTALSR